jgi:hypothetical protein
MTTIYRIDLSASTDPKVDIEEACNKQLDQGKALVSTFVWGTNLYLIFQPK